MPSDGKVFPARRGAMASVALVTPYFPFFDGVFPDEYRERQAANARSLAEQIVAAGFRVHHLGLTDSESLAVEHATKLAAARPDVVLVAPMMAAPATHSLPIVQAIDRPVVVCQIVRRAQIPNDYDEITATEDSTLLGVTMACAGLRKEGRRYATVTFCPEQPSNELHRVLNAAVAVTALAGKRVGVIGLTVEGYVDVEMSGDQLAALGFDRVDIGGVEVVEQFDAVPDAELDEAADTFVVAGFEFEASPASLARDLRLTRALTRVAAQHHLDALALNCHDAVFRRGSRIGIPACLAGTALASAECPVTCTGDVSTAIALLVGQQFTPDVLYCEPFTYGYADTRVVLGSCGIGTASTATGSAAGPPRVCTNYAYPGVVNAGGCARFGLPAGPATVIAYVPAVADDTSTGRIIWMTGQLTGEYFARMHGPNAVLRLDSDDPRGTLERWAAAGPAHHVALAAADLRLELDAMNRLGRFELVRIA